MFKNQACFTCSLLAHIGEVFSFALLRDFQPNILEVHLSAT